MARKLMWIAWPGFLAACLLQMVVFAFIDPLQLEWGGHALGSSRQALYAISFFVFWVAAMLASALTTLLSALGSDAE